MPAADEPAAENAESKPDTDREAAEAAILQERERINKENQRKLDEWNEKIQKAKEQVAELNTRFGDWYYVVSEEQYQKIRLPLSDLIKAFRWFLQYPLQWPLPDPSSLCIFRGRLGRDGFRQVFDQVVGVAREKGVVKDRLRLKDATHVIANIAVPSALALVAQTRDKLLAVAEPFAPVMVEGELVNLDLLRETTKPLKPEERLATRVAQLREMLHWMDDLTPPADADTNRLWQKFLVQRDLAHKILDDRTHPDRGDRTVSTTDPDARCGKHGDWFDGYLVDILVDSDSEIITQINVLAANGDEAGDAAELLRLEEAAQGNDVQALSIDGVGFNGPVLRELEDPEGLNVDPYVPVPEPSSSELFSADAFVEDAERSKVTCPAGETSQHRFRDEQKQTTKLERKLGEIVNRHGGRRASSRGHHPARSFLSITVGLYE
jgi:hypothetical protein